jgi:alcohol dehydrogenase
MRALLCDNGKLKLVHDHSMPVPAYDEALIRVTMAGICNTDLEIIRGYMGFNGIIGHEFVGIVEAAQDKSWIGQRVVGEINCWCGQCETCLRGDGPHCPNRTTLGISGRNGAMADYCLLPERNLHLVPDRISDEQAVFIEPLAAALEITDLIHIRPTDQVIVLGDGKLGLLTAQILRLTGCTLAVIGHHRKKLDILSRQSIATYMEIDVPADKQADIVVDCTGNPNGFALARKLVRPRGKLILKSTFHDDSRIDLTSLVVDEVTLFGSRCGPFQPALRLLERDLIDVKPVIDRIYPFDEGIAAFEQAGAKGSLKVLLK